MNKQAVVAIFLLLLSGIPVNAQRWKLIRYEAIVGVGTTNVFGDIGGGASRSNLFGIKDIRFDATRPSFTLGLRYKFYQNLAGRFTLTYGLGSGTDAGAVNENRGFTFTTHIIEPSAVFEYYFIPEEKRERTSAMYNRRGMLNNYSRLGAYVFGGIAGCYFSPHITGTENVNQSYISGYSHITAAIPAGVGVKYIIDEDWMVGFELGGRLALSDFIDGYNPDIPANKALDIYYFSTFSAIYRIKNDRDNIPTFLRRWFAPRPGRR